jgi:hypothetical protein
MTWFQDLTSCSYFGGTSNTPMTEMENRRVCYFAALPPPGEIIQFGKLPSRTRELRWVSSGELVVLPPIIEQSRSIIAQALQIAVEV